MRIQPPKKTNKKPLYIIITVAILLAGGVLVYAYINQETNNPQSSPQTITTPDAEDDTNDATDSEGRPSTQGDESTQTKVENKTPVQYEGEQVDDESPVDDERFRIPEDE